MALHDRSVNVDHQAGQLDSGGDGRRHRRAGHLGPLRPDHLPRRRPRLRDRDQLRLAELGQQPPHRRVRRHRLEQAGLIGQHGDVGDALRTDRDRDRDRQIDQHPPRIVRSSRPSQAPERVGQLTGQRAALGRIGQQPRAGMRHDTLTVSGHHQPGTDGSLHLESAFPCDGPGPSTSPESPTGRHFLLSTSDLTSRS